MLIIHRGAGFLVPILAFLGYWLTIDYIDIFFQQDGYHKAHGWAHLLGCAVAATLCYFAARFFQRRGARTVTDKDTGEERLIGGHHSFFFVPMHWWPSIILFGGIYLWIRG